MKSTLLTLMLLLALQSNASAAITNDEGGINRPGADYENFIVLNYDTCKRRCEADIRCQAFTFVRPGFQGPNAVCWLKSAAPNPVRSNCCDSGAKRVTLEFEWNRPGGDYAGYDIPFEAAANTCQMDCLKDYRCMAYTYVKANVQGFFPKCWLKNTVPNPIPDKNCHSGVVSWR
jgi:hypothetical protein